MANDWDVVDHPEKYYIPDTETDAGDWLHIDLEKEKKLTEEAKNIMKNTEFPNI